MSDYLTRLVQRTVGTGPLAQPRIPSRFAPEAPSLLGEPPAPLESAPAAEMAEIDAQQPGQQSETRTAPMLAALPGETNRPETQPAPDADTAGRPVRAAPAKRTVARPAAPAPNAEQETEGAQFHAGAARRSEEGHAERERAYTAPGALENTGAISASAPLLPATPAATIHRSEQDDLPPPSLLDSPTPASPAAAGARARGATPRLPPAEGAPSPLTPDPDAPLFAPQPQPSSALTATAPRVSMAAGAEQAHERARPIVHITIGRVEVRSAPPPATPPPRPAAPAAPRLSLEELLRSQRGERP